MEHFAGLDVSVNETSVCIVDGTGRIVREVKVASEPGALLMVLNSGAYHFKRIGLEAGPLSQCTPWCSVSPLHGVDAHFFFLPPPVQVSLSRRVSASVSRWHLSAHRRTTRH